MALQAKIQHANYNFYQEISSLDELVIADSRKAFDKLRASGTLIADSFESSQWVMTDGVRRGVTINFQIDEVAFAKKVRSLLGCTLKDYQLAMRVVICCRFGYSLNTLQNQAGVLRKFACGQVENIQYDDAQLLLDVLMLLPGGNQKRSQAIHKLEAIPQDYSDRKAQQRTLASYQTYIRFDYYLDQWWGEATPEDRIRYFPVYFWWKVTAILPLRPRECTLTPRNCIRKEGDRWYLTVRRTKLKGTRQAETYFLEQDYRKMEYRIPEELGYAVEQYIIATAPMYQANVDTLFCKATQFSLLDIRIPQDGYYGYPNLMQCLNHFYNDILIQQLGLTVVEKNGALLSQHEIGRINLGDTRHIAMVSLMVSGGSPSVCRALADQEDIDISSNYYSNIESFLTVISREGHRPNNGKDAAISGRRELRAIDRTMKINGGYCQSKRAQMGDFSDCACAVTTEGGFGDCHVCQYFVPIGTNLPEYMAKASQEMKVTCVLMKQAMESIRQGNGNADTLSEILDRLHGQALQYRNLSGLTRLINETEESA